MHPMGQLVFSLAWVLTGTIFLVGLLFEKKKTILPFASVFTIDWSVILIRHLTALEQRSFQEVVLSSGTAVLVGEHYDLEFWVMMIGNKIVAWT